jgi:membrane protease YdiL (CAAX protease family)
MQSLSTALRTAAIVLGIAALASLFNRMLADSGLRFWLLMKQQTLPGVLGAVSALEYLTYGLCVIVISYLIARSYWREMFPERLNFKWLAACFAIGTVFAMFINHPMHVFLFEAYFGKSTFTGGAVSDSIAANIFSGLSNYQRLLTFSAFATIIMTPFVEELTDRGILFTQAEALPMWQVAVLSFAVFCLSHYAIGGLAKVLAVVPAALLFITIRLRTGSFIYSTAAHIAMNFAALMKLQVW